MIAHPPDDVDGLIVMPFETPEYSQAIREAPALGKKVVCVDRLLPEINVSSVTPDHFTGAYQATYHLINAHHRPVYYFGTTSSSSCREWIKGGPRP